MIIRALDGREIIVVIDETGDRKKGKKTDYVSRQYIGNVGIGRARNCGGNSLGNSSRDDSNLEFPDIQTQNSPKNWRKLSVKTSNSSSNNQRVKTTRIQVFFSTSR
jgi:hypothetical protein